MKNKLVAFDTISDPYLTYRLAPNEKRSNIAIDKYGIVHNGEPTNLKKEIFKIIMFGGSTVEGSTGAQIIHVLYPHFLKLFKYSFSVNNSSYKCGTGEVTALDN